MTQVIHLDPEQVPAQLARGYTGRKFKVRIAEAFTIPGHAGNWSGGSRQTYSIVRIADGSSLPGSDNSSAPWDESRKDRVIALEPGVAVVEHSIFNGKDMGLTFHINATDAAPMLPAPTLELGPKTSKVLNIIGGIKSAYRPDEYRRCGLTDTDITSAKMLLTDLKYINKAGAITTKGRNARTPAN